VDKADSTRLGNCHAHDDHRIGMSAILMSQAIMLG
jgi:5-enolpyruvylshikimate-3-phosphate synthase